MRPPITEPLLLERLAMSNADFSALYLESARRLGRRTATPELVEQALTYPWVRPDGSYLLDGDEVRELPRDLDTEGRHPLLAIGSNGAPTRLATKFAHHEDGPERRVPVVTGWLHDHDVGAAAFPTAYGSMAATLIDSPGTKVRSAVLWCTARQFTQLTWSEFSYRLEPLQATFITDDGDEQHGVWVYRSRWGALGPYAQAAIPARDRTATACTQRELLSVFDPQAEPEATIRAIFEDFETVVLTRGERLLAPEST